MMCAKAKKTSYLSELSEWRQQIMYLLCYTNNLNSEFRRMSRIIKRGIMLIIEVMKCGLVNLQNEFI